MVGPDPERKRKREGARRAFIARAISACNFAESSFDAALTSSGYRRHAEIQIRLKLRHGSAYGSKDFGRCGHHRERWLEPPRNTRGEPPLPRAIRDHILAIAGERRRAYHRTRKGKEKKGRERKRKTEGENKGGEKPATGYERQADERAGRFFQLCTFGRI